MKTEQQEPNPLYELHEYVVESPSVQLLRCTTQVARRNGNKWSLILTKEIAMAFGLES